MKLFFTIALIGLPLLAIAQDIRLASQADVDSYIWSGPCGCHLYLGPEDGSPVESDIHDLTPLLGITAVYGILTVENNPHLKSLHGLENISIYQGGFSKLLAIRNNDSLTTLEGLPTTISIVGFDPWDRLPIVIKGNELLVSLEGMPTQGTHLISSIEIIKNPSLMDLSGMEAFGFLGNIHVQGCEAFEGFGGLGNADTIWGVQLKHCPSLKDFNGLEGLRVSGVIELDSLESFENTAGMPNLQKIAARLTIRHCPRLTHIAGLQNLRDTMGYLTIEDCDRMADFSEWSDSIIVFRDFTYWYNDSVEVVTGLHRVHAARTLINNCQGLKRLQSIPTGVATYIPNFTENGPHFEVIDCPKLETINHPDGIDMTSEWVRFLIWETPALNDISGLKFLEKVSWTFYVIGTNLEDLSGLENLNETTYTMIYDNPQLSDISALGKLVKAGAFELSRCNVTDLEGLQNLAEVDFLYLAEAPIDDLSVLNDTKINQRLILAILPNIDTLSGFENMDTIGIVLNDSVWWPGQVQIYAMPNLRHIGGFDNLRRIRKSGYDGSTGTAWASVGIYENPQLESITGFSHLRKADGGLTLRDNPMLNDITGLCPWLKLGQVGAGSVLSGNPPGYNSLAQLRAGCDTIVLNQKEELLGQGFSVFPNPANQEATVNIITTDYRHLDRLELEMFDVTGRSVGSWRLHPYSPLVRVGTAQLAQGMYYFVLNEDGRFVASNKLLVQRP